MLMPTFFVPSRHEQKVCLVFTSLLFSLVPKYCLWLFYIRLRLFFLWKKQSRQCWSSDCSLGGSIYHFDKHLFHQISSFPFPYLLAIRGVWLSKCEHSTVVKHKINAFTSDRLACSGVKASLAREKIFIACHLLCTPRFRGMQFRLFCKFVRKRTASYRRAERSLINTVGRMLLKCYAPTMACGSWSFRSAASIARLVMMNYMKISNNVGYAGS